MEMDNLCRWFGLEMMAVEIALAIPDSTYPKLDSLTTELMSFSDAPFRSILNHYRSRILNLKGQWSSRGFLLFLYGIAFTTRR